MGRSRDEDEYEDRPRRKRRDDYDDRDYDNRRPKKKSGLRVFGIGCGTLVLVAICGFCGISIFFGAKSLSEAEAELAKADNLYDQGKKDEAVAVYKQKFSYSKNKVAHLKRIVEFEAEKEHIAEVRKWVEIGVDAKVDVSYESKMAQQAYAALKKDRDDAERKRQAEAVRNTREKVISYEVLASKNIPFGVSMDVLVNETATKQQVMELAENLRQKHVSTHRGISIFDSREAQRRQTDESYPEAELSKHWLATITRTVIDGGKLDTTRWVAEGRNH